MNERKFLNPSSGFDFTRVQISVGILNDVMHVVKLAGIAARVAECSNDSAVAPMNDPDYMARYPQSRTPTGLQPLSNHGNSQRRGRVLISSR